jgi:ankyrin repeat protein
VQTDKLGYSPLHSAIRKNNRNLAIALINALNQKKPEGLKQLSPEKTSPLEMLQERQTQAARQYQKEQSMSGEALAMGGIFITEDALSHRDDIIKLLQAALQPTDNNPQVLTVQSLLTQPTHAGDYGSLQSQKKACSTSPKSITVTG